MFGKKFTDAKIRDSIINQDLKVYKYLDKKFRPKTVAHVKANSGSVADADELYNQVIFQIYLNIENRSYKTKEDKFAAYFTQIMQNRWIDTFKQRNRKRKIDITELSPNLEIEDGVSFLSDKSEVEINNTICLN